VDAESTEYYAYLFNDAASVEDPSTVYRRLKPLGSQDQFFSRDGTWEFNDWFVERDFRGTETGTVVRITPQQAAAIIQRWIAEGRRPAVEGVDLPTAASTPTAPDRFVFRQAKLFDGLGEDGVRPVVNRAKVDPEEAPRILAYLNAGAIVLFARSFIKDAFFPDNPPAVPLTYVTDGVWIWAGATRYYLEHYGLPPEPDLLAHIRANGYTVPEVSQEVKTAARDAVLTEGAATSSES
jgi:hypothetical protein